MLKLPIIDHAITHPPIANTIICHHPLITPSNYLLNININIHLTRRRRVKQYFVKRWATFPKFISKVEYTKNHFLKRKRYFRNIVVWDLVSKLLLKRAQLCNRILIWTLGIETTIFLRSEKIAKIGNCNQWFSLKGAAVQRA